MIDSREHSKGNALPGPRLGSKLEDQQPQESVNLQHSEHGKLSNSNNHWWPQSPTTFYLQAGVLSFFAHLFNHVNTH
jgi:hypothetical protein